MTANEQTAYEWANRLAESLMAVNAQTGGRNAARLLRDYRDHKSTIQHRAADVNASGSIERIRRYVNYRYTTRDTILLDSELVRITAGDIADLLAERDAFVGG